MRRLLRALLLLAAPMLLAAATPLDTLTPFGVGLGLLMVLLGLVPLVHELGPARPTRRAVLVVLGAFLLVGALLLTPVGVIIFSSDLATGFAIVALAAGALLATSLLP